MNKYILSAFVVVLLVAITVKVVDYKETQTISELQGGLDKIVPTSWWDVKAVEDIKRFCFDSHIAVTGGYLGDKALLENQTEEDFWERGGLQLIEACRMAKIIREHRKYVLDIPGFDGGDPDWWWALSISKTSSGQREQKQLEWHTRNCVLKLIGEAQNNPRHFLEDEPPSGRLDRDTVECIFANLNRNEFTASDLRYEEDNLTKLIQENLNERHRYNVNIATWRRDLCQIRREGFYPRYKRDKSKSPADHEAQWHEDIDQLESAISQYERWLSEMDTTAAIRQQAEQRHKEALRRQKLLDRSKAELKRRVYAMCTS